MPELNKILAAIKPEIHGRLKAELKRCGPAVKQLSRGCLMGIFLGAIATPLAALGAGVAAQALAQIVGGVGGNLLANFIQRYYDADAAGNEAAKQQLLEAIISQLQQEAEKSDALLIGMQHLLEKIDALAAAQEALGVEQANWIKQNLFPIRPVPADSPGHRAFREQVKRIYLWGGWHLAEEDLAVAAQPVDFLFAKPRLGAEPDRLLVHCVDTKEGRVNETMLASILPTLGAAKNLKEAQGGVLVTNFGFSPNAYTLAKSNGWSLRYYDQLIAELINFRPYLMKLREEWEDDEDRLAEYYVPAEFDDDGKRRDLFDYVTNDWLAQPQNFLSIVGEYGVGKTSFSRKLAYELAGRKHGRLPILIRLHSARYNVGVKGLVRAVLAENGMPEVSYEAFDQMNRAGLLLILLDGFDEMIAQAGDFDAIQNAFEELAELAKPALSRVVLTSRGEYFESEKEQHEVLRPQTRTTLAAPINQRRDRWALLRLAKFTPAQMRLFLERRLPLLEDKPEGDVDFYLQKMGEIEDLLDLGQRAVMLDMIAKSLPRLIKEKKDVDPAVLYRDYLEGELERQEKKRGLDWKKQTPRPQRFKLMRALAVDAWKSDQQTFPAAKVKALVEKEFAQKEADEIQTRSRDFLTCSFLIRPGDAHYKFSHRSIQEYLLAEDLAARLLAGETMESLALSTAAINFIHYLLWPNVRDGEFYRRQIEAGLKKDGLPEGIKKTKDGCFFSQLRSGLDVKMVYVPAGPFVLGAESNALQPQIAILEKGFWIDKTPVTVEQFRDFVKATKYVTEAENSGGGWTYIGGNWQQNKKAIWRDPFAHGSKLEEILQHPVTQVSWNDAQAFCKWAGKILPSEQQWEKASRGLDGRRYPWGNAWDRANCNSASFWAEKDLWDYEKDWKPWWEKEFPQKFSGQMMTTPVGQFKTASPYGCVDSAGNVWEWGEDFYDEQKSKQVLRGGAWNNLPHSVACAIRNGSEPDDRSSFVGFRCART